MAPRARQGRLRYSTTSEGPRVLPVLTSHHAFNTSRAPSPYPLFPLCLQNTSAIRDRLRGPCDALLHFLRFIRFLRSDLVYRLRIGGVGGWIRAKTPMDKAGVAVGSPPSAPLNRTKEVFDKPLPTSMGRETLVWGGCARPRFSDSGDDLQDPPACSCARSVRSATRRQLSVPQPGRVPL
jgi:hypothetical protein